MKRVIVGRDLNINIRASPVGIAGNIVAMIFFPSSEFVEVMIQSSIGDTKHPFQYKTK